MVLGWVTIKGIMFLHITVTLLVYLWSEWHKNCPGHSCWTHEASFWISEKVFCPARILGQFCRLDPLAVCAISFMSPTKCHRWSQAWQNRAVPGSSWNGWTKSIRYPTHSVFSLKVTGAKLCHFSCFPFLPVRWPTTWHKCGRSSWKRNFSSGSSRKQIGRLISVVNPGCLYFIFSRTARIVSVSFFRPIIGYFENYRTFGEKFSVI